MFCSAAGIRALAAGSASAAAPKDNPQQALSVFILYLEQASPALSIIGQLDRIAFDGCINRFSRLGSLTFAVYPYTKKSLIYLGSQPYELRPLRVTR